MQTHVTTQENQQRDTIVCPKCLNCGVITWEYVPTARGLWRELSGIAGDFYERLNRKAPRPIELVCTICRTVLRQERELKPSLPGNHEKSLTWVGNSRATG